MSSYEDSDGVWTKRVSHVKKENWSDACINQGMLKIAANHQKPGRGTEEFLTGFRGTMALSTPCMCTSSLQKCLRQIAIVLNHSVCEGLLWQPHKTRQLISDKVAETRHWGKNSLFNK